MGHMDHKHFQTWITSIFKHGSQTFSQAFSNMDHKHFQPAKRPFSVIFNCKPTNQVIRYEHEGQVSAKIMLEQKADFLKFDSN